MYGLKTESSFDASHFLTDYHGKCENLHGHRWRVVAYLEVEHLQKEGTCKDMVVDFGEFKAELRALTERLDHHFIVEEGSLAPDTLTCLEREGFALFIVPFRTTAENLAKWFFDALAERGLPVAQVEVYETPNTAPTTWSSDSPWCQRKRTTACWMLSGIRRAIPLLPVLSCSPWRRSSCP